MGQECPHPHFIDRKPPLMAERAHCSAQIPDLKKHCGTVWRECGIQKVAQQEQHVTYHRLAWQHQGGRHLYLQQRTAGSGVGLEGEHHLGQERCCGRHTGQPGHGPWARPCRETAVRPTGSSPFLGSWSSQSDFSSGSSQAPERKRREKSPRQTAAPGWFRLRFPSRNAMAGKQRPGRAGWPRGAWAVS